MIKKENLKQAIDAISARNPETGYSLNEMLGTGQIDVTPQLENASQTDDFHFLFDREKVSINKFLYFNEGIAPIEQGMLIKYGELVKKQEVLNRENSFNYMKAAEEIRDAGLKYMVTHEIDFALARLKKRHGILETNARHPNLEHPGMENTPGSGKLISFLGKLKLDNETLEIPGKGDDPAVLYKGVVNADTPSYFICFPFCMDSLMQVAAMNLEFFHVRFLLNCLIQGLEKNLFICMVDRKILGLIYLTLKEQLFYKGLEIKFVATLRGKAYNQTESSTRVFKGVGTFLVSGVWMLWKTQVPEVREIFLDSEIGAMGFYEAIGFQSRRLSQYALRTPKGQLVKAILIMANNSRDLGGRAIGEICAVMEKQIKGLRKKAKNEKQRSARKAVIASVKESLKSRTHPELAETTLSMLRKYRDKITESEELIQFATQYPPLQDSIR